MLLNYLNKVIIYYPCLVLFTIFIISIICCVATFTSNITHFKDPQMGFQTRGTDLSNKITAWKNLLESTKPSGALVTNPRDYLRSKSKPKLKIKSHTKYKNKIKPLDKSAKKKLRKEPVQEETFFCGSPNENYAKLIIKNEINSIFNIDFMLKICDIEKYIHRINGFNHLCIMNNRNSKKCCRSWSLPNYIALYNNKSSCFDINENDIKNVEMLLRNCSTHFHKLSADCSYRGFCDAPEECIQNDGVYNILNYLLPKNFITNDDNNTIDLPHTMIILPIACSFATMSYYKSLEASLTNLSIVALDFGIKNNLFDEYLISDSIYMIFSIVFIAICILFYTRSTFLMIMIILAIIFALFISYCIYTFVFGLKFFPFMNLLALIIAIGIGTDDAFIFCKAWCSNKQTANSLSCLMSRTFNHSVISMFVTSLTTSVAFFTSYFNSITALKCFGLFTGITILINYILMITWLPAAIVVNEKYIKTVLNYCQQLRIYNYFRLNQSKIIDMKEWSHSYELFINNFITNFRIFIFISFTLVSVISFIIILYYPKLQLPNTNEIQLFHKTHPFEQYDLIYKNMYWFNDNQNLDNYKLPLRFVFGVLPVDNGDYMNPQSLGTLQLDSNFNMSSSQEWLLNFCMNLKRQSFYHPTNDPLLVSCFIESFKQYMERSCSDPFNVNVTRFPCCNESTFPYSDYVFNYCIIDAMADLYRTPKEFFTSGLAGPRFSKESKPVIKAVIIEYDSNCTYNMLYENMTKFLNEINNWIKSQLESAPDGMKNGFFITDFEFYDLKNVLITNTLISIIISIILALLVLFLTTLNVINSLFAIISISFSISTTIAVLILIGWKLNIFESVAISSTIGITIDFSLHYCICYNINLMENDATRESAVKYALNIMLGPVTMAALTTAAAGCFMLLSEILVYKQIGQFLITVILVSWSYATFFFCSMLCILGPESKFGQYNYKRLFCFNKKINVENDVPKLSELRQFQLEDNSS